MRTYRLFVCYFVLLVIGVTVTAFIDRSPNGFSEFTVATDERQPGA